MENNKRYKLLVTILILLQVSLWPTFAFAEYNINQVQDYLNSVNTFSANFKQYGSDGKVKEGRFLLAKPGRVKWEYLSPKKVVIIGNGKNIVYYDYELEEASHMSTKSVLAHFLSKEKLNLNKDVKVEKFSSGKNYSLLVVTEKRKKTQESHIKQLTLKFEHVAAKQDSTIKLIEVDVVDHNGQEVEIVFSNVKVNINIDKSEFVFKNPNFFSEFK